MDSLSAWLQSLGLERYAAIFAENGVELDSLPLLDEADLEKLGVLLGHRRKLLKAIAERLSDWQLVPAGTEGYRTAEVTLGGVDTREVSSKTLESLKVPGLYFIGEVLDVTGHLGGFNFQWAWASGYAAAQYV